MPELNRPDLKAFFQTGDKPTEAQFIDLIDSLFNFVEDGQPLKKISIVQTLNAGDNNINHALNKEVLHFSVRDGNDFVQVDGSIVDANNFTISLAAGNIVNATIILIYEL